MGTQTSIGGPRLLGGCRHLLVPPKRVLLLLWPLLGGHKALDSLSLALFQGKKIMKENTVRDRSDVSSNDYANS